MFLFFMDIHSKKIIRVDNSFTECQFNYTQEELDILFFLMSIIRKNQTEYLFSISDIEVLAGKQMNSKRFRVSISELGKRPYESLRSEDDWDVVFLFRSVKYRRGMISVEINEEMISILCDLKSNYTSIQLASGFRLNGKYSKRLYLLLSRWKRTGGKVYEIDHLMDILQYERKDTKDRIVSFKRMLSTAIKDINKNTEMHIDDPEWIKTGRPFTHVKFSIRKGRRINDLLDFNADTELVEMKKKLLPTGISSEDIERLHAEGCTMKDVKRVYEHAEQAIKNGTKISNPGAYVLECFRRAGFLQDIGRKHELIETYRRLIENGTPVELLTDLLKKEGISIKEVLNNNNFKA